MNSKHKYYYEGTQDSVDYTAERMETSPFTTTVQIDIDGNGVYEVIQDFSVRGEELRLVQTTILHNDLKVDMDSLNRTLQSIIRTISRECEEAHILHLEAEAIEIDNKYRKDSKFEFSGD